MQRIDFMSDKKPKKEKTQSYKEMVKSALNGNNWVLKEDAKNKVDAIYDKSFKSKTRETARLESFTDALNSLLLEREIDIKRVIESKNEFSCNERGNDKINYYFKLTSNISSKLAPTIKADELLNLLKERYTDYSLIFNDLSAIKEHIVTNLDLEIEAKSEHNNTFFLIDIYKYKSPNEAYINFEKLCQFSLTSIYRDITESFKHYSIYPGGRSSSDYGLKPVKTDFNFKSYIVTIDDSDYILQKRHYDQQFSKTIFLVYNLVIIIYDFSYFARELPSKVTDTAEIFNIIQNYIFNK